MPKAQIRRIVSKVKETKVRFMVTIIVRVIMFAMDNNFNRGNYGNEMIGMGPMFLLKIVKLFLGMVEVV